MIPFLVIVAMLMVVLYLLFRRKPRRNRDLDSAVQFVILWRSFCRQRRRFRRWRGERQLGRFKFRQ